MSTLKASGRSEREERRERERGGGSERVKIVYMHLHPAFRGEGCSVAMVTRWLIGRTTDAGRWFVGEGGKSFEGFLAAWSIIPRDGRGRLWSVQWPWQCPITSRKLHHNAREAGTLFCSFFPRFYNRARYMKICLPSVRRCVMLFIFFRVLIRLLTFCKIMVIYSFDTFSRYY